MFDISSFPSFNLKTTTTTTTMHFSFLFLQSFLREMFLKATAFCCYFERLIQRGIRRKKRQGVGHSIARFIHWPVIPKWSPHNARIVTTINNHRLLMNGPARRVYNLNTWRCCNSKVPYITLHYITAVAAAAVSQSNHCHRRRRRRRRRQGSCCGQRILKMALCGRNV